MNHRTRVCLITISDRASKGEYPDRSGPEAQALLIELLPEVEIDRDLVPDDKQAIAGAITARADRDAVITLGGTGIGARDVTPEVSRELCDRDLPGIAETLRAESLKETPHAMLSRGYAGMMGTCAVINLPGSVMAARLGMRVLSPVLGHIGPMVRGEGH